MSQLDNNAGIAGSSEVGDAAAAKEQAVSSASSVNGWVVTERTGSASDLHLRWSDRGGDNFAKSSAEWFGGRKVMAAGELSGSPALVLGSAQAKLLQQFPDQTPSSRLGRDPAHMERRTLNTESGEIEMFARRSGGGAVYVSAGSQIWIDAWVPRDDELWHADNIESSYWLGSAWKALLEKLGATSSEIEVHRAGASKDTLSKLICFAGVGPGEVMFAGAKVVGIAQRRDRLGSWFHSIAYLKWNPETLVDLLCRAELLDRYRGDEILGAIEHLAVGVDETGAKGPIPKGSRLARVFAAAVASM